MVLGQLDIHTLKNEATLLPHSKYKIISKWIKDLNRRTKTTTLLEEKGVNLHDLRFGDRFLDMIPNAQKQKGKTG